MSEPETELVAPELPPLYEIQPSGKRDQKREEVSESPKEYQRIRKPRPKKEVVKPSPPSFFVLTLEEDTDEEEEASSAIDWDFTISGTSDNPKSHSLV